MEHVFSLPPLVGEDVVGFRLVPTVEKEVAEGKAPVPALLFLTQQRQEDEDTTPARRHLKIVRCPKTSVDEWALELADVAAPRKAAEVLPGSCEVTVGRMPTFVITVPLNQLNSIILSLSLFYVYWT